jgi:hypothetical protein
MNSRRVALVFVRGTVPAVILGLGPADPPQVPVKDFSKATAHKVVRVIDGDTIVVSLDGKETVERAHGGAILWFDREAVMATLR